MTFLTVEDALTIGGLTKCELIAGTSGLHRRIKLVDTMEVPNISPWLRKGVLLVTTAYSVKDNPNTIVELIREMARIGAAGLALKTRFIGTITSAMVNAANDAHLPLITIPHDLSFADIIPPLMKAIVSTQNRQLEFSQKINEKFIQVGLNIEGFSGIANTLSDILGTSVKIFDKDYLLLGNKNCGNIKLAEWTSTQPLKKSKLIKIVSPQTRIISIDDGNSHTQFLQQSIIMRKACVGFILVPFSGKTPDDFLLLALSHAANSAGLEFAKKEKVEQDRQILDNSLFIDLLTNNVSSEEIAIARASALNWSSLPITLVTLDIDAFSSLIKDKSEEQILLLKSEVAERIKSTLIREAGFTTVLTKSDSYSLIVPATMSKINVHAMVSRILQVLQRTLGIHATAGIANPISRYTNFPEAYNDTRTAIRVARYRKIAIVHTSDYPLDRFLYRIMHRDEFADFAHTLLAPILDSDIKHQTEYLNVLECYVKNAGQKGLTAATLFIHRNTLQSRLKQIESLMNIDLNDPEVILTLAVAIRINKMFD